MRDVAEYQAKAAEFDALAASATDEALKKMFGGAPMRPKSFLSIPTLCVVLALSAATPAFADIRILGSTGGEVGGFLKLFEVLRESGERIVIDGPCYSACTLVLSTVPRERICVTRLGFHGARLFDYEGNEYTVPPSLNAAVADVYPEPVQRWIARRVPARRWSPPPSKCAPIS